MKLISSGAYLQGEFSTEIGLIPPSFLPIGNRRLYEYQIKFFIDNGDYSDDIYLSIPESYILNEFDLINLKKLNVNIIYVPDGLTLGESVLYCWNLAGTTSSRLTLLHGDTLFLNFYSEPKDIVSTHPNRGFYKRAKLGYESDKFKYLHDEWSNDSELVLSGFFNFENPLYFMESLVKSNNDFTEAIVNYHQRHKVALIGCGNWLDFGHINSFYHARSKMTTQRDFNNLEINKNTVVKKSVINPKKIFAEGRWFSELPLELRVYTPALLHMFEGDIHDNENSAYTLEYLHLLPLNDLFVFGNLSEGSWASIFKSMSDALADFSKYVPDCNESSKINNNDFYLFKTLKRLNEFETASGFSISDHKFGLLNESASYSLSEIAINSAFNIQDLNNVDMSIIHGDFCFSNILYDSRSELIKCIDPRGLTPNDELSIYGDRRYDISKIYHSVIGMYDFIIAGHYNLDIIDKDSVRYFDFKIFSCSHISFLFRKFILAPSKYSEKEILSITIQLFLSMLPLHSEKPMLQQAFIANSIRLYHDLEGLK
jgi:hypothetical protein